MTYVIGETWNSDDLDWQTGGEEGCEYALSNDAYTQSGARAYAQSRGGDLAGCLEGDECDWLFSEFHPGTEDFTRYWLGGLQDPEGEEPDDGWYWVFTGYPIYPEDPWLPGQPDDGTWRDHDVAALVYNHDGGTAGLIDGLDDIDDEWELRAIIQRDPDDICTDGITDYTRTYAWEFRYDGARQRYLRREVDPNDFTMISEEWSDYSGDSVYADFVLDTGVPGGAHTIRDYLTAEAHADSSTHGVWDGEAYYHTDQIGSTRLMTDGTPQVVREYVYDAFGNVYESSGTATTRYRYAGASGYQSHDDFPFLHVGARYYDPETGRFLQRDPIGIHGGLNVYGYVRSNPTSSVDPEGFIGDWNTMSGVGADGTVYEGGSLYGRPKPVHPPGIGPKPDDSWSYADEKKAIKKFQKGSATLAIGVCGLMNYWNALYLLGLGTIGEGDRINPWSWPDSWFDYDSPSPNDPVPPMPDIGDPGYCFVSGTTVLTSNGPVDIEHIVAGHSVLTMDLASGSTSLARVVGTMKGKAAVVVDVNVDGESLRCTRAHPFWVQGRGWVHAAELRAGDRLLKSDGQALIVISVVMAELPVAIDVYNIQVQPNESYFVGQIGVLVHNKVIHY